MASTSAAQKLYLEVAQATAELGVAVEPESITAISAAVSTLVAFASLLVAGFLWRESILVRRNQEEPQVIAYLVQDSRQMQVLNFVVANIGPGLASSIEYRVDAPVSDLSTESFRHIKLNSPYKMHALPPGERLVRRFEIGFDALRSDRLKQFTVTLKYRTRGGAQREATFPIDVDNFSEMFAGDSVEQNVLVELTKMRIALEKGCGHSAPWTSNR